MVNFLGWRGLCGSVLGPAAVASALMVASDAADAHSHVHLTKQAATVHRAEATYSPPSASIVVDGNTGEVLHAFNADGLRHPASLTKIMTLYLLFERLESGLDSRAKCNRALREPDLHVFAKVFEDCLKRSLEAKAFSGREIGGDDDVLDFLVGHFVDVDLTRQPAS